MEIYMTIKTKIGQLFFFFLIYQKNTYIIKKEFKFMFRIIFKKSLMNNLKISWMLVQCLEKQVPGF